ncbi:MAG: aspartate kinase [Deltaproteobacteria bacterium]|nr:aspartate kinase [Deltaproteobacteria bacterium]
MIVMKFGGSSLANADKIRTVIDLVRRELDRYPAVVVSAHGGTTDKLLFAARAALSGKVDVSAVEKFHLDLARSLGVDPSPIAPMIEQLSKILQGVSLVDELSPRTLDHIMSFGERLSAMMVASAMNAAGLPATSLNSFEIGLRTDSHHGHASPLSDIDADIAAAVRAARGVAVITGFLGRDPKGNITTLGRSGSDFSASIVGAALQATEIQIWTDVNGVMTADPSIDSRAENLPVLSFTEASELAYYGAEVLHPSTLVPALRKGIPVRVLNTTKPQDPGTLIVHSPVLTQRMAKSVVYKEDVVLIHIASPRLMSAARLLSSSIERLATHGVGVHLAATSEATVSMVTDRSYSPEVLESVLEDLGRLGNVTAETGKAIVCVVGAEMQGKAGTAGRILATLGDAGITARMISQSASEINIALVIDGTEISRAVCALHGLLLCNRE